MIHMNMHLIKITMISRMFSMDISLVHPRSNYLQVNVKVTLMVSTESRVNIPQVLCQGHSTRSVRPLEHLLAHFRIAQSTPNENKSHSIVQGQQHRSQSLPMASSDCALSTHRVE